jgi:hypothetical protein
MFCPKKRCGSIILTGTAEGLPSPSKNSLQFAVPVRGAKEKYKCDRCGVAGGFCDIFPAPEGSGFDKLCRQCSAEIIQKKGLKKWKTEK